MKIKIIEIEVTEEELRMQRRTALPQRRHKPRPDLLNVNDYALPSKHQVEFMRKLSDRMGKNK